jgi:hypothetical protein
MDLERTMILPGIFDIRFHLFFRVCFLARSPARPPARSPICCMSTQAQTETQAEPCGHIVTEPAVHMHRSPNGGLGARRIPPAPRCVRCLRCLRTRRDSEPRNFFPYPCPGGSFVLQQT